MDCVATCLSDQEEFLLNMPIMGLMLIYMMLHRHCPNTNVSSLQKYTCTPLILTSTLQNIYVWNTKIVGSRQLGWLTLVTTRGFINCLADFTADKSDFLGKLECCACFCSLIYRTLIYQSFTEKQKFKVYVILRTLK